MCAEQRVKANVRTPTSFRDHSRSNPEESYVQRKRELGGDIKRDEGWRHGFDRQARTQLEPRWPYPPVLRMPCEKWRTQLIISPPARKTITTPKKNYGMGGEFQRRWNEYSDRFSIDFAANADRVVFVDVAHSDFTAALVGIQSCYRPRDRMLRDVRQSKVGAAGSANACQR